MVSNKVSNIARCSNKTNESRDIDSVGYTARNITIQRWEIDNLRIDVVRYILNFGRLIIIRN